MKTLKYALLGMGVMMLVIGAVLAYVAATFDPNAYKPQIIQMVKKEKQRTLRLDGDVRLTFWPSVGANIGKLALSEFRSEKEFLAVENARVSLKLMPLFAKRAVVDEIAIRGLRANLVRLKNGRMNIDDLLVKEAPEGKAKPVAQAAQVGFDIDHVVLENAALTFRDEMRGAQYSLSGFDLKTGRIAPGVPSRIEASLTLQGDRPTLSVDTALKTRFTFDLDKQIFSFEDFGLAVKGQAAGIAALMGKASGSVAARLKSGEFSASKLSLSVTGTSEKNKFDIRFGARGLNLSAEDATGEKVVFVAQVTGAQRALTANLNLPSIEGKSYAFRSPNMTLAVDIKQGEQIVKARLASPVTGSLQARQVSLPRLKMDMTASGPRLPGRTLSGEFTGTAGIDAGKGNATAYLAGKVADSTIRARLNVATFSRPLIGFDFDVDQVDLDRYRVPKPAGSGTDAEAVQLREVPFDLSGLRGLRANGGVRIGSLNAKNIKATNVRLDIRADAGRVDVNPVVANLYRGSLSGVVSIDATAATPTFSVRQNLNGVSIGPLLRDFADNDTLEGRGNLTVDVTSQGNTVMALKRALNGAATLKLTDGAVKGIDLAGSIRTAVARLGALGGEQARAADRSQKTDFSELSATFNIRNGVAKNDDLSLKSPMLRVRGGGTIDLGQDSINYLVRASVVGTIKGQGGREIVNLRGITLPVRVSGPLAAPSYQLDFKAMVTDTARRRVEKAITERLLGGGAGKDAAGGTAKDPERDSGSLRDSLKRLFGR